MTHVSRVLIVLALPILVAAPPARADDPIPEGRRAEPPCGCFRGGPIDRCCGFWLFESGLGTRAAGSATRDDKARFLFTADLGYMRNLNSGSAVGGSFFLFADDDGTRLGLKPRYRFWFEGTRSVDVALGVTVGGQDNEVNPKFPGIVGSVSASLSDLLAADVIYEAYGYEREHYLYPNTTRVEKGTATGLYVSLTGRSYLAPVVPLTLLIAASIAFGSSGW